MYKIGKKMPATPEDYHTHQSQIDNEEKGYHSWQDSILKKLSIVSKPFVTSEDSMGDSEQPENGNELTDCLEDYYRKSVFTSRPPEESLDNTSDQNQERLIQSEQDTVRHEKICSPVIDACKEFKCPPCLKESFTFVPTPADNTCGENTHSSAKNISAKNSQQVNSETIQVSLTKDEASGRNVVGGNDSTQNTKGQSTQEQKQQQQQQQQSASSRDSNVSGAADQGNGRTRDDGDGRRRGDGDRKNHKSAGGQKNKKQEEAEEDDEDEEDRKQEMNVPSASGEDSSNVSGSGSGDHGNERDDGDKKKDKSAANGEQKNEEQGEAEEEEDEDEDEDEEKQDEENQKQEIDVLEQDYISQCMMVYIQYIRDQNCGRQVQKTEFTTSGERYLGHLQQCGWGHTACKNCHWYLYIFEDLVSSRPVDAASLFPFYEEFSQSNNREERYLVILAWLYGRLPDKYVKAEECHEKLKRIRSSSGQGSRPKKRFKQAVASSSNEPMEITPSPEDSPLFTSRFCGACHQDDRPRVIRGSRKTLHQIIQKWTRNRYANDGEFNEGVIFNEVPELIPVGGYYRPHREFRFLQLLGFGSYGEVCLGFDGKTDKLFVYKIVHLKMFEENEVLIWMCLQHNNIVPLWGVVRHGNNIIMISDYVPTTLPIRLGNNIPYSDQQIVKWIKQLLGILEYIHSMNIVHMDIKPENMLIAYEKGGIVLIDWGLSMKLNANGLQKISRPRGTKVFMAREVACCETFNATVDIWSLMCTAICLFSGNPPWVNRFKPMRSYLEIVEIIRTHPPPVEDIPPSLDPVIRDFLTKGFGNDQGRPTASELLEHPMFSMDNFTRQLTQPTLPHDLNIEEMEIERFPIPPPDGLLEFDICSDFKPLGDEQDPHSGDSGGCDMGQNLPTVHPPAQQQGLAFSPECRVRDSPSWLDNCTILQPLGQASHPGALAQDDSPDLDDLTSQLDQLNIQGSSCAGQSGAGPPSL